MKQLHDTQRKHKNFMTSYLDKNYNKFPNEKQPSNLARYKTIKCLRIWNNNSMTLAIWGSEN